MLAAFVALLISQAVLVSFLVGTELLDRHPLLPEGWRQRRALRVHQRRLERLGGAVQRARLG